MALRLGKSYPVRVGSGFAKRMQSLDLNKSGALEESYQMGTSGPVGLDRDNLTYTGSLAWNPVDNEIERRFGGQTGTVSLKQILDATGILVQSKSDGISYAKISNLQYSCQVGGPFTATAQLRGTGWNDGDPSLSATGDSYAGQFKSRNVALVINGTRAARVASFNIRVGVQSEDNYEMGNADSFETTSETPTITADVELYEDTLATVITENEPESPVNMVIGVGNTDKLITLYNAVWQDTGVSGRVRGKGTRRYTFKSKGDTTTDGLLFGPNVAPTGTLAASPTGASAGALVTFTATVADTDGVYKVHFYKGTTKIGETSGTGTTHALGWTANPVGTHVFTAKVEDIYGSKAATASKTVTVS